MAEARSWSGARVKPAIVRALPAGDHIWTCHTDGPCLSRPVKDPRAEKLYFGSDDGNIYCVHTAVQDGGRKLWTFNAGEMVRTNPVLTPDGKLLLVGTTGGQMFAIDTEDGTEKWRFKAGGPIMSSPVLSYNGDAVYFGSDDNCVYRVETADGSAKHWPYVDLNGEVSATPALSIDGETLYVPVSVHSELHQSGVMLPIQPLGSRLHTVVALSTKDGVKKWQCVLGKSEVLSALASAAPAVCPANSGVVYAGYEGGNVRAIDGATGMFKWEAQYAGRKNVFIQTPPALNADGTMLYVAGEHDLIPGDKRAAHEGAMVTELGLSAKLDRRIFALNASTGRLKWSVLLTDWCRSPITVVADQVFFGSADGGVYAINAKQPNDDAKGQTSGARPPASQKLEETLGATLWDHATDDEVWCQPTVTTDWFQGADPSHPKVEVSHELYVGSHDYNMYAISARLRQGSVHRYKKKDYLEVGAKSLLQTVTSKAGDW